MKPADELRIVTVPKELYYHEVAYVRGLEAEIERLRAALTDIEKLSEDDTAAKMISSAVLKDEK
jgi:hypothetical protein